MKIKSYARGFKSHRFQIFNCLHKIELEGKENFFLSEWLKKTKKGQKSLFCKIFYKKETAQRIPFSF
jgi:hypothetical protein